MKVAQLDHSSRRTYKKRSSEGYERIGPSLSKSLCGLAISIDTDPPDDTATSIALETDLEPIVTFQYRFNRRSFSNRATI